MKKQISVKDIAFRFVSKIIRDLEFYKLCKFKDDSRPTAPFKLVFFCGKSGIGYLNASLFSVYRSWKYLPAIVIVSDGTPTEFIKSKLIQWPRDVLVITWEQCAMYYKSKMNEDLYRYATEELWGKKLVSVLYCAEHFPTLYSDSDVLWYSNPKEDLLSHKPFFMMAQDVEMCYSEEMLHVLNEEDCMKKIPLNAGVIFANGDFSSFGKWKPLCSYLNSKADNRSEQTAFAILSKYYSKNSYWSQKEVLIKIDDKYSFKYTKTVCQGIIARHYVNLKNVAFWRDFLYMCMSKKNQLIGDHKEANVLLHKR